MTYGNGCTYSKESNEVIAYMIEKMKLNELALKVTEKTIAEDMVVKNMEIVNEVDFENEISVDGDKNHTNGNKNDILINDKNDNNVLNNNNDKGNVQNSINNNEDKNNDNNSQIDFIKKPTRPIVVSRLSKRKYKDNISLAMLGTTTIAGRYKKMGAIPVSTSTSTNTVQTEKKLKIIKLDNDDNNNNKNNNDNYINDSNNNNNDKFKEKNKDENNSNLKSKNENNDILVSTVVTAGQFLVRLNFFLIFNDKIIVQYFSDSIKKRLNFETKKKTMLAEYEIEIRRRKLEEMNNLPMLRTAKESKYDMKPLSSEMKITIKKEKDVGHRNGSGGGNDIRTAEDDNIKNEMILKEEVEDSFEAMLGSPQDLSSYNMQINNNNNSNNNNNYNNNNDINIKQENKNVMNNNMQDKKIDSNINIKQESKGPGSLTVLTNNTVTVKKVKKVKNKIVVQMIDEED